MASESTEEQTVTVTLPDELDDWLDEHAATLDVDRDTLLVQLLSSYRTTVELDGEIDDEELPLEVFDGDDIENRVEAVLDEELGHRLEAAIDAVLDDAIDEVVDERLEAAIDDRLGDVVDERIEATVADDVTEEITESTRSVQRQLEDRIEGVESDFDDKITDVRERVIQVKKEADAKAADEHSHEELEAVESLEDEVTALDEKFEQLREEYDETIPEQEGELAGIDDRLETVEERLQTVAWVVSDLRSAVESDGGLEAVERIKRAAAKADIQRAKCENCGNGVTLSLLTDPECPHCEATVTNVEPAGGWFSDPKLLVASQLEAGEER